jgi:toxin ParE1/3/4
VKVTWTEEGIDSYDEVVEFLSERSLAHAGSLEVGVLKAVQQISEFPESGRMVPERENPRLREVLVEGYRLIYRLSADGITVEILLHASVTLPD